MANFSVPPPFGMPPPPLDCVCPDVLKDLSCVKWGAIQWVQAAVFSGFGFGVITAVGAFVAHKYKYMKKQEDVKKIPTMLDLQSDEAATVRVSTV